MSPDPVVDPARRAWDLFPAPVNREAIAPLTPTERGLLFGWGRNVWGSHGLANKLVCRQPERRFIRWIGAEPVSHVGLTKTTARVFDADTTQRVVTVAGVGSVITPEAYQRRGHAAALLDHVLTQLAIEKAADLAMLFCLDHRTHYYGNQGWLPVLCPVTVAQPQGQVIVGPPYHVRYWVLRDQGSVAGAVSIDLDGRPW